MTRLSLEQKLIDIESLISPITIDDYALFRSFGNGYKNTLTYNAQAVNGWNPKGESTNRLGLKYYDKKNLISIGYFKRYNSSEHFHIIPCESSNEKIKYLADLLYKISNSPVYIKKINKKQKEELLTYQGFIKINKSNGWYKESSLEDDTYPEQVLDLKITLAELSKIRKESQIKDKYVRAIKRYIETNRLTIENYDITKHKYDALNILKEFFNIQREKHNHLSSAEDYFNIINTKPDNNVISSIFFIDKEPAAFYLAERTGYNINVYANLSKHNKFMYLSEFILIHLFKEAEKQEIETINLGGSETQGLNNFKMKFKPIEQRQMHWLLYENI